MNSTRKITGLCLVFFFAFVFIPSIFAEPLPGEELVISEEVTVISESIPDEESAPAAESLLSEEAPIAAEYLPNEESTPTSEPLIGEKVSVFLESLSDEESILAAEAAFLETLLNKEPVLAVEPSLDEDDFFDEDLFFFEAAGLVFEVSPVIETRSFNDVFPSLLRNQKTKAMGEAGLRYSFEKEGSPTLIPAPDSGINLLSSVMEKNPSHIIEALVIVPYKNRELDMLDIYNALGRIKNIKDHKITLKEKEIVIFKDTTRLVSDKNRKPVPDPSPTNILPYSETMYLLFLDPYLGDLYLKGEISYSMYGITYSMTNFRDVTYSIFRVMKSGRFSAFIYLEPVKEGILIYSVSGIYLPNFIAKRINLTPNMNRRITVLLNWITDGLRIQEERRQDKHFYRLRPKDK